MRWLLVKDLQILRRSPLLVVLLVAYPVLVALLIGFALSGGPEKPRVAFVNLVPEGEGQFSVGGETRDAADYSERLFKAVDPIRVDTREEAIELVESGDALGALIIPRDAAERLRSSLSLTGSGERPQVEVIYNGEDPLKQQFVEATIESQLAEAARHADRVLVLADGELLFSGTPGDLASAVGPAKDFEAAFVQFLSERGH